MPAIHDRWSIAVATANAYNAAESAEQAAFDATAQAYRDATSMSYVSREPKNIHSAPGRARNPTGLKQTQWVDPTPGYARRCKAFAQR